MPIVPVHVQPKNNTVSNYCKTNCEKDVTFHVSSYKNPQKDGSWKNAKFLSHFDIFIFF